MASRCTNGGKAWPFHAGPVTGADLADEPAWATLKPEAAHEVSALAALVGVGLVEMRHDPDWCGCSGTAKLTMRCVALTVGLERHQQHNDQQSQRAAERFSGSSV